MDIVKNKLYLKILMYFLSLLIPIIVIGCIVYLNVDHMAKRDVTQKLTANLKFSSGTIDIYLGMAHTTNNNLLLSDVIQQHLTPYPQLTDSERVNLQLIVRAIAQKRNEISSFIDYIFLYADAERVFSSEGLVEFNTFFDKFYSLDGYDKPYWEERLHSTSFFQILGPTQASSSIKRKSNEVIPSISTQYVNGNRVTLVTTLSVPAIASTLKNNALYSSTAYLITDGNGHLILNTSALKPEAITSMHEGLFHTQSNRIMKIDGVDALVVNIPSDAFGWNYISITPLSAFSGEAANILSLVIWICISLILIGIIFSFIFSVNLYNPIRNIKNILLRSEQDMNAGGTYDNHDELTAIGSMIRQLVQHNRDASIKLNEYSSELLDQFFTNMMKGSVWTQQEPPSRILDELKFQDGNYLCCCFLFHYKERFYEEVHESDRIMIEDKMKNVIWGLLRRYVSCYVLEAEPNLYAGIVNLKQPQQRELFDEALEQIKTTFQYDSIYCRMTVGIGKLYDKPGDIVKSYSDAITAIVHGKRSTGVTMTDAADLAIEQTYYYSFLDENKIVNGLKAGNLELLRAEVERLLQANKNIGVSYTYLGALLTDLMHTGVRFVHDRQLPLALLLSDQQYAVLVRPSMSPGELHERTEQLLDFYGRIALETAVKGGSKSGSVVSDITRYIEQHYADNIYLETIADEIGLSPKYVSRLFKETTGTSITQYISLVRISKAKELLAQTDMKVSEISERIGITSRTTFLRLFKKHESLSPLDYRQLHTRKQGL
ncbi:AraC family transcriptional regulator [Paenibacillus sp. J5C_2022]|uniref:AraC family transcriptional regulator n=1 Tax=Paenibacillus sp. J5C2022 TaxID=2977129 RepID=UPI0021CDEC96|nr:AraC family transcriptional regulator [Paenibacillus sp. J5C2022]MCU6707431.1 AraC family transcriptional regulator [Paenibacillus sp. J5C2022]